MLRARSCSALAAIGVCAAVLSGAAQIRAAEHPGAVSEVPLPGGLRAALAAIDDRVQPDRSHFLLEFIRRTYPTGPGTKHEPREAALRALLLHLDTAARPAAVTSVNNPPPETLPLPLPPSIWIDTVFSGRATPQTLVADIVRSRGTALLYYGLLALDDETRAWLAGQPELLRQLAAEHGTGFAVAAPGLRVANGAVRVPGGGAAAPAWEALVGRRLSDPLEFVRAIVADRQRRLPYFIAAMAQLTPAQAAFALNLKDADASARVEAVRRLHGVFERIAPGWLLEERTFWRPALDPALLVSELPVDADGTPVLVGTRKFWNTAFADDDARGPREDEAGALLEGKPVDFVWIAEQVFGGDQRRRYPVVLFASRVIGPIAAASAGAAVETLRAFGRYPALVASIERAGVRDLAVHAAASRRAARLSSIEDEAKASRALAQFQGALALLTRAGMRGGVPAEALPRLLTSLSEVEFNARDEYDGGIVRWLDAFLRAGAAARMHGDEESDSVERAVIDILAGAPPAAPQFVEWEGTRYLVDGAHAERARLTHLLGADERPYLSTARALVEAADALTAADADRETHVRERSTIQRVAQAMDEETRGALERLARELDKRGGARVAAPLRAVADTLAARGLMEFAYAVALGHPERTRITAADAAGRHQFGLHLGVIRRVAPWRFPASGSGSGVEWHVVGSLLGLDVKLSEFALIAVSSKPPARRPSVPDEERRVFIEAVALVEGASLADADRDAIASGLQRGRARVAALATVDDAAALAKEIQLSPVRSNLLQWATLHDREALSSVLSLRELLALAGAPNIAGLHAWGAPAEPRLGCLCLDFAPPQRGWVAEGRWNAGVLASTFTDLNLRLAELLAELRMPAALLPGVLASATLEFVNTAECRDPDDRRGLVDFVRGLRADRVEQYLALLTSDGPLVPAGEGTSQGGR